MIKAEVKVSGLQEITERLKGLEPALRKTVAEDAMTRALGAIAQSAKERAPSRGRDRSNTELRKSLKERFEIDVEQSSGAVIGKVKNTAPHAHLMEYGFSLFKKVGTGLFARYKYLREVEAHPPGGFMRQALEQNADKAVNVLADQVDIAIERELTRRGGRT